MPFQVNSGQYFVNIDEYVNFCKRIGNETEGRAQAFFGQHLNPATLLGEQGRKDIINSITTEELVKLFEAFDIESQRVIIDNISSLAHSAQATVINKNEFQHIIRDSTMNPERRKFILSAVPQLQLETLKAHRQFLASNLDKKETFIQNWIDGKTDDVGKEIIQTPEEQASRRRSRCLIFGLEYINHKREGSISQKRFDVLTRISEGVNEYVLFELKSPSGQIFKISHESNSNGGQVDTYSLSDDISRALPQISSYKRLLQSGSDEEWQRIGLSRGHISKSIIMVGTRPENNKVWEAYFGSLKETLSSSVEIMTYTDLLHKLDVTIKNLKENLR